MQVFDMALILVIVYILENFKQTMRCVKNCVMRKKKKMKPQKQGYAKVKKFQSDIDDDDEPSIEL